MLILQRPWKSQPPRGAKLKSGISGLVHYWLMNGTGIASVDSLTTPNVIGTFGTGSPTPYGVANTIALVGKCLVFDNTGTGDIKSSIIGVGNSSGSGSPGSNVFTVAITFSMGSVAGNQTLYGAATSGLQIRVTASGQINVLKADVASMYTSGAIITAGKWYTAVISYNGSTVTLCVDGAFIGSGSSTQTFTHSQQYAIGSRGSATASEPVANGFRCESVLVFNRALSTVEAAYLSGNRWAYIASRRIEIPTSTAAATVPTLSASTYVTGSLTSTGWRPQVTAS